MHLTKIGVGICLCLCSLHKPDKSGRFIADGRLRLYLGLRNETWFLNNDNGFKAEKKLVFTYFDTTGYFRIRKKTHSRGKRLTTISNPCIFRFVFLITSIIFRSFLLYKLPQFITHP